MSSVTHLGVEGRAWVLLDAKDVEVKGCFELGVRYVSLFESETSWADESFVLWCFPRETFPDEGDLRPDNTIKHVRVNTRVFAFWVIPLVLKERLEKGLNV